MKVRKDFVTNSSSSSFICDVCGYETSGWDMGLYDAEMVECENGHIFCDNEVIEPTREKLLEIMDSIVKESKYHEKEWEDDDEVESLFALYLSEYEGRYNLDECMCPICQMEVLTDNDFISYTSKKYKINSTELLKEIKEQFGTYKEFKEWLKKK